MRGVNFFIGTVCLLVPLALFLTASGPSPVAENNSTNTTPYNFNLPYNLLPVQNPKDNPPTEEGVELGRKLFYDPVLSGNHKQSCAGCHKQELSFTDGLDYSIGALGKKARRNSMALVNLGWQDKYFWDGRARTLEDLVHFPITDSLEMNADYNQIPKQLNKDKNYVALFHKAFGVDTISMPYVAKALGQFLRTIVSFNAPFDIIYRDYVFYKGELQDEAREVTDLQLLHNAFDPSNEKKYGHDTALIQKIRAISPSSKVLNTFSVCLNCHYNSLQLFCIGCNGTIQPNALVQYQNNGLETVGKDKGLYQVTKKEEDKYLFKTPTLRNLVFTAPYMHDGRFKTLEEVVEHYNSGLQANQNLDSLLMDDKKAPLRFNLNAEEKRQLIGLLKLFSDSSLVTNSKFSAPTSR